MVLGTITGELTEPRPFEDFVGVTVYPRFCAPDVTKEPYMRATAVSRALGAFVLGGAVLTAAACSSGDSGRTDSKATACEVMRKAISGYNPSASGQQDLQAVAKVYTDTAAKIRTEATRVNDDPIKTAAAKVAAALDALATDMRSLATGNARPMDFNQLTTAVTTLQSACPH